MKALKEVAKGCALAALVAVAGSGCVAIPCGTQTFTTEYPTDIRATAEKAEKTYEPSVLAMAGEDGSVEIGLYGEITTTRQREQHYNSVSLTKRKRLAVGLYPDWAEQLYRPKDALQPVRLTYVGNGKYSSHQMLTSDAGGYFYGAVLYNLSLGILPLPFLFLDGLFGSFDHEWHYLGKTLETRTSPVPGNPNFTKVNTTHDSRDIELLAKFPAEDRRKIGAWTWRDDAQHPQNSFWHGFCPTPTYWPWPGVYKYSTYVVHEPVELERTTPAAPETTVVRGGITGPYGVFLQVPEIGLARTLTVPRGEKTVRFTLAPSESGATSAQATVRFLPPSGGPEEAWDEDARALLEQAEGQDFPVEVELPLPRLGASVAGDQE